MATPLLRKQVPDPGTFFERRKSVRDSTALRLLSAERSEEIFPILLEEIIALGLFIVSQKQLSRDDLATTHKVALFSQE